MILIGQYDSPFVRRVAVALQLYRMPYDHRPWSTFADAALIAFHNPLRRVPVLVLDDGEALIDSAAILDHLDEAAGAGRLIPSSGPTRRAALRLCALASGVCDKMVSLVYERVLHEVASPGWVARCETQIGDGLDVLERDRAGVATAFWHGGQPGHADIEAACAWRFLTEAHPALAVPARWPGLVRHAERCERLDAFGCVVQPFTPPAR